MFCAFDGVEGEFLLFPSFLLQFSSRSSKSFILLAWASSRCGSVRVGERMGCGVEVREYEMLHTAALNGVDTTVQFSQFTLAIVVHR